MRVPLSNISNTDLEKNHVLSALTKNWLSGTGDYVPRFEGILSRYHNNLNCVATSNGTTALEVTLRAFGIGRGDEVIVPGLTFAAPANAVLNVGARPVIVDVDEYWLLSKSHAMEALNAKTKAVIGVDLYGHPLNYDKFSGWGIVVIEDAAEAHGAMRNGKLAGTFGDAAIFSFHANKVISCGEGGAVLTRWDWIEKRVRRIVNHGMTDGYWHDIVGGNSRLNNLSAAFGFGQAQRWADLVAKRKQVFEFYDKQFSEFDLPLKPRPVEDNVELGYWLYTVVFDNKNDRTRAINALKNNDIDARVPIALARMPIYEPYTSGSHQNALNLDERILVLPTWVGLEESQVEQIVGIISKSIRGT